MHVVRTKYGQIIMLTFASVCSLRKCITVHISYFRARANFALRCGAEILHIAFGVLAAHKHARMHSRASAHTYAHTHNKFANNFYRFSIYVHTAPAQSVRVRDADAVARTCACQMAKSSRQYLCNQRRPRQHNARAPVVQPFVCHVCVCVQCWLNVRMQAYLCWLVSTR